MRDLFQYVIAPALIAVVGFYLGTLSEFKKDVTSEERLFLEHRMKIFIAAGEYFEAYRLSYGQLMKIGRYEWELTEKGKSLTPDEQSRKNRYVDQRDKANASLLSTLRAARLFFSPEVEKKIEAYLAFDAQQGLKTLTDLPSIDQWAVRQKAVLDTMRTEVRNPRDLCLLL